MRIKFDKDKCLQLFKEKKSLEKEGKSLRDYDTAKHDELLSYLYWIEDQVFWESRKEYLQILNLVVSKKITLFEFFQQFGRLRYSNFTSYRIWKKNLEEEACGLLTQSNKLDFQVNPESYGFTNIISKLHWWIDLSDPDITLEMDLKNPELSGYGISEELLKIIIEKDFIPELEKYWNKS